MPLDQMSPNFVLKDQTVNIFDFADHRVSVRVFIAVQNTDSISTNGYGWVPIKFIYQNRQRARLGPRDTVC